MRNVLIGLVLVVAGVSAVFALDRGTVEDEPPEVVAEKAPSAKSSGGAIEILPPVVQPGMRPAAADQAQWVVFARMANAESGGEVLLERWDGDKWGVVDRARQDARGRVWFRTRLDQQALADPLRATAVAEDGSRASSTSAIVPEAWTLELDDEFAGRRLDESRWIYRAPGFYNPAGRVCSMSDKRAVSVSGGTLQLQVRLDPDRADETCATDGRTFDYYLNGHVATEKIYEFTYGVAAARVKFPRGQGQHGAFWLQRAGVEQVPGDPRNSGAEIDVVEYFGEGFPGGGLASFVYYLNGEGETEKVGGVWPRATRALPPNDAWWRSYHVFSVEWSPRSYVFRVDGREIFRTREGVSGVEQFLVLSLLSSDWELPKLDGSSLPTTMDVDWVRVWKERGSR